MPASIRRRLLHWVIGALVEALNGIAIEGLPSRSLRPCAHWARGCRSLTRPTPKAIADTFSEQEWRRFAEPVTFKAARSFASHPAELRLPRARLCAAQPSPRAAGADHQHEARASAVRGQDRLGVHRRRDRAAAVQRRWPAWNCDPVCDRAFFAQAYLRDCPTKACAKSILPALAGEEFFQHEFPHERSDLSHWRKRLAASWNFSWPRGSRV